MFLRRFGPLPIVSLCKLGLWYLCYETYGKTMTPITKIDTEYGKTGETVDSLINVSEKVRPWFKRILFQIRKHI